VTICTHERGYFFGEIENGEMILNDIGKIAYQCRIDIPKHFPHVTLDEFVVMPNHVHGVLMVNLPGGGDVPVHIPRPVGRDVAMQRLYDMGMNKPPTKYFSQISPKK